jgi:hypothetical protein
MRLTRSDLEDLFSVRAQVDTVVIIPLERGEEDRTIWRVVFTHGNVIRKELNHLQAECVIEDVLRSFFIFVVLLDLLECRLQSVEVEGLISEDSEFVFRLGIEMDFNKTLVVAWQLRLR